MAGGREHRDADAAPIAAYEMLTNLARERLSTGSDHRASPRQPALLQALADLPFDERAALLLVVLEGFGYDSAAQILHAPREVLVMRLMRARAFLTPLDLHPPAPHDGLRRAAHLRVVK